MNITYYHCKIILLLMMLRGTYGDTQSKLSLEVNEILQEQSKTKEIIFIVDWSSLAQQEVLASKEIPATIFETEKIINALKQQEKNCPIIIPFKNMTSEEMDFVVEDDQIYQRKDMMISSFKLPLTLIVWVSLTNIEQVLHYIEDSVMWCHQRIDLGLLDIDTKLIFIAEDVNGTSTLIRDAVLLTTERIKTHPNVIVLESKHANVILKSYNTYRREDGMPRIEKTLLSTGSQTTKAASIFPSVNHLNGKTIKLIHVLYAHYIQAYFLPDGGKPHKRLTGHYGLIPEFFTIFTEHYDASIEFFNPEPLFDFGGVLDDGSWSGQVKMLWEDFGDISLELAYNFPMRQVLTGHGYGEPEYASFASPKYIMKSKTFAFLKPFGLPLWLLIIVTMLCIPVVLYVLGQKYHAELNLTPTEIFNDLMWFSFSTFMGEVKVSGIKIVPFTQRGLLGGWLVFSMILGFAYSGTLKSHLMTPESVLPIDSLEDIVESSFKIKMAVYNDVFDQELETTSDPIRSRLWAMHEPLQEFRGPLKDVEKGEAVNINWKSHLNAMVKIHHSTSDGKALIHLSEDPIMFKTFLTCNYTPDKPWGPQLDRFTRHFETTGIFQYLKAKALRRLRREERDENRKVTSPFLEQTCPEGTCPLVLEHFAGTSLIYVICLACSILGLIIEVSCFQHWHGKGKTFRRKSLQIISLFTQQWTDIITTNLNNKLAWG